jgi:hypothetical protein
MAFDPFSSPVDYIVLGGNRSPGIARIESIERSWVFENRRSDGQAGANKVFKGRDLSKISVRFELFDAADLAAWETFANAISYPDNITKKEVRGLDLVHPIVSLYGIKAVTLQKIGALTATSARVWSVSIDLEEWREPAPVVAKVKGAQSVPLREKPDSELTPLERELREARRELERQRAIDAAAGRP